jgi:hypothetical protein
MTIYPHNTGQDSVSHYLLKACSLSKIVIYISLDYYHWWTHSYILHHNCLPFKFVKEPNWSLHIWTTTSHQSTMKSGAYHTQTNNYKLVTRSSSNCPKPQDILLTLWGWRTVLPVYNTLDVKVLHLLIWTCKTLFQRKSVVIKHYLQIVTP